MTKTIRQKKKPRPRMSDDKKSVAGGSGITIRQEHREDLLLIDGYGDGGFRIKGRRFEGAVLIMENGVWPMKVTDDGLIDPDIAGILDSNEPRPDILLLGMGERLIPPSKALREALRAKNFSFDPMDSGAAARTYNVLLMEGRRVAALLLPVA